MIMLDDLTTETPPQVRISEVGTGCLFYLDNIDVCMRIQDDPRLPDLVRLTVIHSPTLEIGAVLSSPPEKLVGLVIGELELLDYPTRPVAEEFCEG